MTNKNPFEIRTDLLKMAQDHLISQYHANVDFMREFSTKVADAVVEAPKYPTLEDIMEQAQKFYTFVSTSGK